MNSCREKCFKIHFLPPRKKKDSWAPTDRKTWYDVDLEVLEGEHYLGIPTNFFPDIEYISIFHLISTLPTPNGGWTDRSGKNVQL